eukprot:CAMPEP_0181317742 /NCGR_PEP_ID=MMETSP1101-20121128/16632_1 /TAXON_ID=46948 /ORGANISM="Rhodomonas abbreviata, Strain Caron Lab Isolate" /LENGTH=226 /DNA_ID=CAMNT_0023425159 /DNA_START=24 /DNA_END=701 /DNA_ORIENTATION=-
MAASAVNASSDDAAAARTGSAQSEVMVREGEVETTVIVSDGEDDDVIIEAIDVPSSGASSQHRDASGELHRSAARPPDSFSHTRKRPRMNRGAGGAAPVYAAPLQVEGGGASSIVDLTSSSQLDSSQHDDVVLLASPLPAAAPMPPEDKEAPPPKGELPQMVECPICLNPVTKPSLTKCGHLFCDGCIRSWLESNKRCPHCRARSYTRDLRLIFAFNSSDEGGGGA